MIDFYNNKNDLGVKECWSFKTAKLIMRKRVSIDQRPPWNQRAVAYPSCYHESRYIFIRPDQTH